MGGVKGVFRATRLLGGRWLSRQRTTMTILNMYSARPILPALFAARYLSWAACPHQPVGARRREPLANTARSLCKHTAIRDTAFLLVLIY